MEAGHEPPRCFLDHHGPVALNVLLDAPVALLGREPLVLGHAPDLLPQQSAGVGLNLSRRDLWH